MTEYVKLQYILISRRFKEMGFNPLFAFVAITAVFSALSLILYMRIAFFAYLYLFVALAFVSKLSEIKRNEFLKTCFNYNIYLKIRIVENLVIAIPFIIMLVVLKLYIASGILVVLATIMALANFKTSFSFTIPTPFGKTPYEFTVGFRNSFYLIILSYILTIISVNVDNYNLGLFSIIFTFLITYSYYLKPENEYYVWIHSANATRFLTNKLLVAIKFSTFIATPAIIVLSFSFYMEIILLLLIILLCYAFFATIILAKYSSYPEEISILQTIIIGLCVYFPFMLIAVIPYFYFQSLNKLQLILK